MPEGPEVETVRRTLRPLLLGARLGKAQVSSKALRTKVSTRSLAHLDGRVVVEVERHGKALFIELDDGGGLQVRLGMTGKLLVVDAAATREPHTHVRVAVRRVASSASDSGLPGSNLRARGPFDVVGGAGVDGGAGVVGVVGAAAVVGAPGVVRALGASAELRYVDARRFGEVVPYRDAAGRAELAAGMGPDALTLDDAGRAAVRAGFAGTSRALKDALLDQGILAGVGNIYAAEILWLARLSPFRPAGSLTDPEAARLIEATVEVLAAAVRRRGTSFSDYVDANGAPGDNAAHLRVFQREGEPCPACARPIRRAVQGARSTFYCASCQPQHRRRGLG